MPVQWGGSILISCSPERLWSILVDAAADTDWRAPWVRSVRSLTPGPTRAGSRYESRYNFFRLLNETSTSEITAFDPPRRLAWRAEGPLAIGEGSYRLEPVADGTRFTLEATHAGRGVRRLLDGPFGRHLDRNVVPRQLAALRALAETPSGDI